MKKKSTHAGSRVSVRERIIGALFIVAATAFARVVLLAIAEHSWLVAMFSLYPLAIAVVCYTYVRRHGIIPKFLNVEEYYHRAVDTIRHAKDRSDKDENMGEDRPSRRE